MEPLIKLRLTNFMFDKMLVNIVLLVCVILLYILVLFSFSFLWIALPVFWVALSWVLDARLFAGVLLLLPLT